MACRGHLGPQQTSILRGSASPDYYGGLRPGGEAFERAREAVNELNAKRSKTGVLTSFVTSNDTFDLIANTIYDLQDTLLQSISIRQWQTINVLMETNRQDLAAKKLRLSDSTVSRNLRRGFWWQIQKTTQAMERIITTHFLNAR
jgi:hypothetical protein